MSFPLITPELITRIERFHTTFGVARMQALAALPGNPYGAQVAHFGEMVALKTTSPLLRGKNRVGNVTAADLDRLDDVLAFFQCDDLQLSLNVPFGQLNSVVFQRLTASGFWSGGAGTVPGRQAVGDVPEDAPDVSVHLSDEDDKERYLDVFQEAFGAPGESNPAYRQFQWAEDTLPNARRYIATIDGAPVGMASLLIFDGVGLCGTAGVLPAWRGRGVQRTLLARRITDAASLGLELVIGGGSLFSTTHRNFERAGMHLVPLGTGWGKMSAAPS